MLRNSPRRLVSATQIPLKLFSRYSILGIRKFIKRKKPVSQFSGRLMEDRVGKRVDLIGAPRTGIAFSILNPIETSFRAFGADKILSVFPVKNILQTGVICRKLGFEVLNSVFHRFCPLFNGLYT